MYSPAFFVNRFITFTPKRMFIFIGPGSAKNKMRVAVNKTRKNDVSRYTQKSGMRRAKTFCNTRRRAYRNYFFSVNRNTAVFYNAVILRPCAGRFTTGRDFVCPVKYQHVMPGIFNHFSFGSGRGRSPAGIGMPSYTESGVHASTLSRRCFL